MSVAIYDMTVPVLRNALTDMAAWLDKATAAGADEPALLAARLAPDMHPLTAQFQLASDGAKGAVARLAGVEAPAMPDTEGSFAELAARCRATVAFIDGVDRAAFADAAERTVELRFPNGMGYRFSGAAFLTGFALPNFFFHVSMAYALLRAGGVPLGKADFLQHLGRPTITG
jgi:hypothetical protein